MAEATEKITVNLSVVDLGKIDLLVEQGFYANRTDFLKDAIRRGLDSHESTVTRMIERLSDRANDVVETSEGGGRVVNRGGLGVLAFSRGDLEAMKARGQRMSLTLIGMVFFAADVTSELVDEVVDSARIYGSLKASPEVKAVLRRKMESR